MQTTNASSSCERGILQSKSINISTAEGGVESGVRRRCLPLHAGHVRGLEGYLCAGIAWVAGPAIRQLILALQGVEAPWGARQGVSGPLWAVETSWASQTILYTWRHQGGRLAPVCLSIHCVLI